MNSFVWQRRSRGIPTGLLVLIALGVLTEAQGREWLSVGRSGYSSTYHTQSWYDTLHVTHVGLLGSRWDLGQRLDLLRKDLSTGPDLRQRRHRFHLSAGPVPEPFAWILNIDGDESAILQSVDRRTFWSRMLLGGVWRRGQTAQLGIQVGGVASKHRAAGATTDDQGFARRLTAGWDFSRTLGQASSRLDARARASRDADQRDRLASDQTSLSWEVKWRQPGDSVSLEWEERWRDTRFYPAPDEFDKIGRQNHRYRFARVAWSHPPSPAEVDWLPAVLHRFGWHGEVSAGLDRNTYALVGRSTDSDLLPGDVRTSQRSYRLGASRRLSRVRFHLNYGYRWVEEKFRESRRDQTAETGELDAAIHFHVRQGDSVGVNVVFRITSYSIPQGDTTNFFFDRDQAERVVDIFWWHRFSDALTVRPLFSYRGFRQVFLSKRKSANNNTDNIYFLAPLINWTPVQAVNVFQQFGIRAHYRFLDFSRDDPEEGGTLYRRAESITSLQIGGTRRTTWSVRYTYRYEDFGGLFDRDGWVQSVDWDRRSHLINSQFSWRPSTALVVRPAFGLEYKRSFKHRRLAGEIRRIEEDPFDRQNVSVTAEWNSASGYVIHLAIGRRVQQFGSGPRDRDDRWEFTVAKGI